LAAILVGEVPGLASSDNPTLAPAVLEREGLEPETAHRVRHSLTLLLQKDQELREAAKGSPVPRSVREGLVDILTASLTRHPEVEIQLLQDLHSSADRRSADDSVPLTLRTGRRRAGDQAVAWMLVAVLTAAAVPVATAIVIESHSLRANILRVFSVLLLASFPAFLLARFMWSRAGALWSDFVLNLHRLGMDKPRFLPQPMTNSIYFEEWLDDKGWASAGLSTIYQKKFTSAYGPVPSANGDASHMMAARHALPAHLTTLVLAVLWTAALWGGAPLETDDPLTVIGALTFGFLGAYSFSIQTLIRRYFQADLRPSAYTALLARLLFVLVASYTVHLALPVSDPGYEAAVLFLIGFFPMSAVQVLRVAAAKILSMIPDLGSDYPLSELDGMNIWYEARLMEVGIENMQNLVTANLTDVLLSTHVPVARLVDWVDQSILYLHLPAVTKPNEKGARSRLRLHGIRAATDLQDVIAFAHRHKNEQLQKAVDELLQSLPDANPASITKLLEASFAREPNLYHVTRWKKDWAT
jgi:hypothetical protein